MGFFDDQLKSTQNDIAYIKEDVLGIKSAVGKQKDAIGLPWDTNAGSTPSKSKFFSPINIDAARWDQLFPYRLLVVDANRNNSIVGGPAFNTKVQKSSGDSSIAIINFERIDNQWVFRLPISPQSLTITDQYAVNTSATLRGVLEEHGGVRFKMISINASLGVWPYRESIISPPASPGLIRSVFGGTLDALTGVVSQVSSVVNSATGKHPASKPTTVSPPLSNAGPGSTGYYQALALQQFLEQYAEAKKEPENSGWRLVLDMPKQNQAFVVTPLPSTWSQNANKPLEINIAMQFKAWRRITIGYSNPAVINNQPISPGLLQSVLETVTAARKVMAASLSLIGAVRSDVTAPLEALRQTSLFIKDLSGVAMSAADLPSQILRDYQSGIANFVKGFDANNLSGPAASDPSVTKSFALLKSSFDQREGLSIEAVANGQLGKVAQMYQSIDPSRNVLNNPNANFSFFDQVPLDGLTLNNAQQAKINGVIESVRQTTVDDLKKYRATMLELALQLSNNFGAGDAYYNTVYGRPTPADRIQPMTLDEYDILKSIYDTIQSYDMLTATTEIDDIKKKSNMEYVAGLAELSDIQFKIPTSKILVPVPFGLNIEQISMRYLGDPQRWLEIVTLNNLRDPYIDEDGFQLKLLSNATGRQITVTTVENLFEGQRVVLKSATQTPDARRILGIDRLSDTAYLLTLDGEPNLDGFTTVDLAYLQAYLPGTVNSQQKIFIPSDIPVDLAPIVTPPAATQGDPLTGLSKVDWLQTDSGDVAINTYGDFRLSSGMTNIIQALRTKIGTIKGTVISHPGFGLGIQPGIINSELTAQDIFEDMNEQVQADPRYQGIQSLQIAINAGTLSVSMGVVIAGNQGVFPVTFEITA